MNSGAIVLVGMMGVGKSTIGRLLAEATHRSFVDTDRTLVSKLGRPVPQLFAMYGEATFRDHETRVLMDLKPGPLVISTGGGIVLREENWAEMRRLGTVVFLAAPMEVLLARLAASKKKRPLLQTEDPESRIKEIYAARRALYEQADVVVEIGDADAETASRLVLNALEAA